MIELIINSFQYVVSDRFFLISMAFTVLCGMYIGALLYDGNLNPHKPIAGAVTIVLITIFYVFGMWWGVFVTKKAGRFPEDE